MIKTKIATRGIYKLHGHESTIVLSVGADQTVKVQVGNMKAAIPYQVVVALQSPQARAFVSDPSVAAFFYGSNDRDSRLYAAEVQRRSELQDLRRSFVAACIESQLADEQEAWILSRLKYPG